MTLAAAIVAIVAALLGAVVGGLLGFFSAYGLEVIREKRQREGDKKAISGALAAEIRGLLVIWKEMREQLGKDPQHPMVWVGQESYFSVFDNAGHRLFLLPQDVATGVVTCYVRMKEVYDILRLAATFLGQDALVAPDRKLDLQLLIEQYSKDAIQNGDAAAKEMDTIVQQLEAIAQDC